MTPLRRLLLVPVVLLLTMGIASPALAEGPLIEKIPWERTRTIAASPDTCPFDIVVHSSGTFTSKTYFDEAGNPTHNVLTVSDFHIEWSNPISGTSLTTPLAGPFVTTFGPDGSATITVPGNDGRFVVAGEGIVFGAIGLLIYNVEDLEDPSSPIEIVFSAGIQDASPFPAVCSGLA
jgi:hypothetical protein